MGLERHREDPHEGSGCSPKLTLVGRLAGTVDNRPWSFSSDGQTMTLELPGLATALKLRRAVSKLPAFVSRIAGDIDLPVRVRVGRWPALKIGSRSLLLPLLLPGWSRARRPS